jgi:methionyl-tRNA synthetase
LDLLAYIEGAFNTVGTELESVHLRAALQEGLRLASLVNQYLDQTAPWITVKHNKDEAALSIYTALKAIDSLKIIFAPFLPFTCQRLHEFFGYEAPLFGEQYTEDVSDSLGTHTVLRYQPARAASKSTAWRPSELLPGTRLAQPQPLFKKLDVEIAESERQKLGRPS